MLGRLAKRSRPSVPKIGKRRIRRPLAAKMALVKAGAAAAVALTNPAWRCVGLDDVYGKLTRGFV